MYPGSVDSHTHRLRRKAVVPAFPLSGQVSTGPHHRERVRQEFPLGVAALRQRVASQPEDALDLIAQEVMLLTAADGTAIALAQDDSIICRARAGMLAPPLGTTVDLNSSFTGACLRTGDIVSCDDSANDPRLDPEACRENGIRSILAVPICGRDKHPFGILAVFSETTGAFGQTDTATMQLLAELICDHQIQLFEAKPVSAAETLPPNEQPCNAPRVQPPKSLSMRRQIASSLDVIRQDPALQLLGRVKAYLTIEALYDGVERSHAIELCKELMFQRANDLGVVLGS